MAIIGKAGALIALAGILALAGPAQAKKCPGDSVQVGHVCFDKYEASVWEIPAANTKLIKKVQKSKIGSAADLSGATQRGLTTDDYPPACPDTGNGCTDDYAVSIAGVQPSASITWFQAATACRNAGKRLATNAEWQAAALGTPDPGTDNGTSDCNITGTSRVNTGARSSCVSDAGAFDMVGNLWEWVADWGDLSSTCTIWDAVHGNDITCVGGNGTGGIPGALARGGYFKSGTAAGVFAATASEPSLVTPLVGFRCAHEL
jgi:formylglycine-generating enzyme required for sulfatase activity